MVSVVGWCAWRNEVSVQFMNIMCDNIPFFGSLVNSTACKEMFSLLMVAISCTGFLNKDNSRSLTAGVAVAVNAIKGTFGT